MTMQQHNTDTTETQAQAQAHAQAQAMAAQAVQWFTEENPGTTLDRAACIRELADHWTVLQRASGLAPEVAATAFGAHAAQVLAGKVWTLPETRKRPQPRETNE